MVAEQVTTTDQLVKKTVEVPKEKDAYRVAQEKYKKQMKIRIKLSRIPTFHWQERQGDSTGANVGTNGAGWDEMSAVHTARVN